MHPSSTRRIEALLLLAALSCASSPPAHAYLDPGTGSYIVHLVLATALGALYLAKVYWRAVVDFLRRCVGRGAPPPEAPPPPSATARHPAEPDGD